MEPVSVSAVLALIDWKAVVRAVGTSLLARLKSTGQEKAARRAIELFVEEFLRELEDKTPLSSAVPGYYDQLKRLVELAAPDIVSHMQAETKEVDLGPVERKWTGDPLPEDFDWSLVAKSFARAIRTHLKKDPALRTALAAEDAVRAIERIAPLDPGFDLGGYAKFLQGKCAQLNLGAVHTSTYERRVQLWSVFVPQSARESVPMRDLPRELRQRLREEGRLAVERDDEEIERLRGGYQDSPVMPVLDILGRERLVVVLGDPGSGKTSLLRFLTMRWVTGEDRRTLPIWIDLKEYAQARGGLLKFCESGCAAFGLDAGLLVERLKAGEAAFYLDGLDEIFDPATRGSIIEEIAVVAAHYTQARVVVTSRIIGYEAERLRNAGFVHATLEDFDDKQVSEFLGKWHAAAEDDAKERSRLQARLERALRESRAIRGLAGNPLLLTMMAILNRNQELPRDRVELYAQASRVLLHEWDASRALPVDTFARQEKEELLRELAGVMQQAEGGLAGNLIDRARLVSLFRTFLANLGVTDPHSKANSLVKQLTERNFILCYAGADRFSFVHRTFLEYFCASWIVEQFQKKQTLSLEALKNDVFGRHWQDESWHEVLRLIAGMVGEKQAEELILFLMNQDGRDHKLANLMLAAGCLSEVRNRRAIQATDEALWGKLVDYMLAYEPRESDDSHDEYVEASSTRMQVTALIAVVWCTEKTRTWLGSAVKKDPDWTVRLSAVQGLARGWRDHSATLPILKDRAGFDDDIDVRVAAVHELALEWKHDPKTLLWLKEHMHFDVDSIVRAAAARELAQGWKDDPETLSMLKERVRSDDDKYVVKAIVQEIARGWKDHSETLLWLKRCARSDENSEVRKAAVEELARGWKDDGETLPILRECVRSDVDNIVRRTAVHEVANGWSGDADTLSWLKDRACFDENNDVRRAAVFELAGWRDSPEVLPILKERVRSDEDHDVRRVAVQELAWGWKADAETLPMLKARACSDQHHAVRRVAVRELARGWKDDSEAILIVRERALSDEHEDVRRAAVRELARGWKGDPETLSILEECARSDEHEGVRSVAAMELARIAKA